MFVPIGDQPNPRGTPVVTYALIAVNVLVFVLVSVPLMTQAADLTDPAAREYLEALRESLPGVDLRQLAQNLTSYDLVVFEYGYRPVEPSLTALFTAMFLHGGFMHLAGNMLFLWIYGDNVEHRLGAPAFLLWYLVTGAAATLFHGVFSGDSGVPLVGASGAISGVLGFYFLWFPHNQVRVLIFLFIIVRIFTLPARWVLGFYLVVSNILPFLATAGAGTGVAYGAHIGGFLAGVGVAFFLDRRSLASQPSEYRRAKAETPGGLALGAAIAADLQQGRYDEAARRYFDVPSARTRRLLAPDDALALGRWLEANGHARAALTVYQRHLRDYPTGPLAAEAHTAAGLLQLRAFGDATPAYQHLVEALDFQPSARLEAVIREALAEISRLQKFPARSFH